jgi:hypothetical protein
MKEPELNIGDKFVSVDSPNLVWEVHRFVERSGHLTHVELKCLGNLNRTVLIGKMVLQDRRHYRKADTET